VLRPYAPWLPFMAWKSWPLVASLLGWFQRTSHKLYERLICVFLQSTCNQGTTSVKQIDGGFIYSGNFWNRGINFFNGKRTNSIFPSPNLLRPLSKHSRFHGYLIRFVAFTPIFYDMQLSLLFYVTAICSLLFISRPLLWICMISL